MGDTLAEIANGDAALSQRIEEILSHQQLSSIPGLPPVAAKLSKKIEAFKLSQRRPQQAENKVKGVIERLALREIGVKLDVLDAVSLAEKKQQVETLFQSREDLKEAVCDNSFLKAACWLHKYTEYTELTEDQCDKTIRIAEDNLSEFYSVMNGESIQFLSSFLLSEKSKDWSPLSNASRTPVKMIYNLMLAASKNIMLILKESVNQSTPSLKH